MSFRQLTTLLQQSVFSGAGLGTLQIGTNYTPFASSVVFMANGSIDTNSHSMNITGVVAGTTTFTFNKIGNGTLTLSGGNLYTGPTHVAAGVLQAGTSTIVGTANTTGAFGVSSNITVDSGATLDFQTYANSIGSLSNSGTTTTSATITATSYTQASSGTLELNFPTSSSTPFGNVTTTGSITLNGTLTVADTGGYTPTTGTEIILLQSSGAGQLLKGSFTAVSLPAEFSSLGNIQYDYSENQVLLGLAGCNGDWQSTIQWQLGQHGKLERRLRPWRWERSCSPRCGQFSQLLPPTTLQSHLLQAQGSLAQTVTLHDINFNATSTVYTIQQFSSASQITLDTFPIDTSKPRISVNSGTSTINAPIVMNQDSRIYLSGGTLTLGASTTITGATQTLYISEGASTGTLTNRGSITPLAVTHRRGNVY